MCCPDGSSGLTSRIPSERRMTPYGETVIVALVASFDNPPLANKRALHVVPVDGAVNVMVAAVSPVAGSVFELFRYFQSM